MAKFTSIQKIKETIKKNIYSLALGADSSSKA